jgi:hypothetical protein
MDTQMLIERLADTAEPVSPLSRPSTRTAIWLAMAIPYLALVVFVMSPRVDLGIKLSDASYIIEQLAALGTGITACLAAFASIIPGFDRRILFLPVVPLAVWLGSLGLGCIRSWIQLGPSGLSLQPDWYCLPAIILAGLAPAITMAIMLRRGAPLTPHVTAALGGLAAAGLGNFGLRLFHQQDASIMVLVWQMSAVFVLTCLAARAGRLFLDWRSRTENLRRRIVHR